MGLTIDAVEVAESDGVLIVTVLRSGDVTERATVDIATRPGTAEGEIDFGEHRGVLEFQPGVSGQQIRIDILDDDNPEPTESFQIELTKR